jgi:hypothetical protein
MNWKRKAVKGMYQKLRMDKAAVEKRKDIREREREREDVEMADDLSPYLIVVRRLLLLQLRLRICRKLAESDKDEN